MKTLSCNHHVASFSKESAMGSDIDDLDEDEYQEDVISSEPVGFQKGVYTFVFDYPLSREAHFMHQLTPDMTWIDLLLLAKQDYEEIYRREDEAAGPTGNIPGMLNRASSDGPFGIWGHVMSDLYFESVEVDEGNFTVNFGIGS
jgi:hypothetical protein